MVTDTEVVHELLQDLLSPSCHYVRVNPVLSMPVALHESDMHVLQGLQDEYVAYFASKEGQEQLQHVQKGLVGGGGGSWRGWTTSFRMWRRASRL